MDQQWLAAPETAPSSFLETYNLQVLFLSILITDDNTYLSY